MLPNGVVSSQDLLKALNQVVKSKEGKTTIPVLPASKKILQQIQNKALTKTVVPHNILKPNGKPEDWRNAPDLVKKLPLQAPGTDKEKEKEKEKGPHIQLPSKDPLPKVEPKANLDEEKNAKNNKKDNDLQIRPGGTHVRPIKPSRHNANNESLSDERPTIRIIDQPSIDKIGLNNTPGNESEPQNNLQKQHQEKLKRLQWYQDQKQKQLQQRHDEKLEKIRQQYDQERQDLQNKNDQKLQSLKQQQDDELQAIQLKQEEKQRDQLLRHQQRMDFEQQQQQIEQEHQLQSLKQMQMQQDQQGQQQRYLQDQQAQLDQLQQYRNQQEQQQQERIKRIQQFRQPQAFEQMPYKPITK